MKVDVGSDLKITEINEFEKQKLVNFLNAELIIDNPKYFELERMGKWTGNTQRYICLYSKIENGFLVPFGALKSIYNLFPDAKYNILFETKEKKNFNCEIQPYDYQQTAIEKVLKVKNGILVAPCGAGKTEMALKIIAEIGLPALWITHTQDLLKQSMERAKTNFYLPQDAFGTITAGKIEIGSHITFATVQTLCKIDLLKYQNEFGVIVVDECHRVGGSPTNVMMFYKCLSNLSARYKIGVTATPKKNGLEKSMFCLFGGLIHEIPKETVESKLCPVEIINVETGFVPNEKEITNPDGTINYVKTVSAICENKERNEKIVEISKNLERCIVLSDRIEHLNVLQKLFKDLKVQKTVAILTSQTKKRKEILQDFKDGKIDILFSTYKLMSEGFDCPDLKYLVFATPQKNERVVTQSVGRVARKSQTKEKGIVFDLIDNYFLFSNMKKARNRIYKKNNYIFEK